MTIHMRSAASPGWSWIPGALLSLSALVTGVPASAAVPAWKPDRPVELIAINAPGGGSDRILRIMINVMQAQKQIPVAVNVVNKAGGGGAVAYSYVNTHPGDGHYLVISNKALLSNHLIGAGPGYTEFTPVANLFTEYISVTVTNSWEAPICASSWSATSPSSARSSMRWGS